MSKESALIVGGGGREHQLGLSVASDVETVFFAPGNAGTDTIANGVNLPFGPSDLGKIVDFVGQKNVGLTIVGPENPLVEGLADLLRSNDHLVFGPGAAAAQLEASKIFAEHFMAELDIARPHSVIVDNMARGLGVIGNDPTKWVLKADGLAGGKGVVLPDTIEEAAQTLQGMLSGELFDGAGKDGVVIQERLHGPELSVFVVCDGMDRTVLSYAQDHKRLKDGDQGPNTGGMGAYAPVPSSMISPDQESKIEDIVARSIEGTWMRNMPYIGVLYIGLMLAEERGGDPVVMEYNVRFGDPEAQVVLPLLEKGANVYELLRSAAAGELDTTPYQHFGGAALTVCLAASGYPNTPIKGDVIHGLDRTYQNVTIQHGGTKREGDDIVTAGGRVLYVTAKGETLEQAAAHANAAIGKQALHFEGMQFREDIGQRAIRP